MPKTKTIKYTAPNGQTYEVEKSKLLTIDDPIIGPPIVINVSTDVGRMNSITFHLESYGINPIRLDAVTSCDVLPACELTRYETNACLSHASANRFCHSSTREPRPAWLILEDDCRFLGDPRDAIEWALKNLPKGWSVASLGCYSWEKPTLPAGSKRHLDNAPNWEPYGAHSYLVSAQHGPRLVGSFASCFEPPDWVLLREMKAGRGYLTRPSFTYQEEFPSHGTPNGEIRETKWAADLTSDDIMAMTGRAPPEPPSKR
jgi:GR25 family glycosyltransferase involved in LPS biosynthesis